ncbi:MAG: phage virion morphogenesis protein [Kaiparowitsia implicata GSE-PSE-MK54-09C]|jgi:phage gpG-like protein|nr:phage virion morphogenesis protein [Kaiparowitsia implicata GSE-PSE-MK54-09C]
MANLQANLDDLTPDDVLRAAVRNLSNRGPLYKAWANRVEAVIVTAFKNQAEPYTNTPWPDLTPTYDAYKKGRRRDIARRKRQAKKTGTPYRDPRGAPKAGGTLTLQYTGALFDSTFARVEGNGVVAGSNLRVGDYSLGAIHQFGAPRAGIRPRRWLPVTDTGEPMPQLVADLVQLTETYLSS